MEKVTEFTGANPAAGVGSAGLQSQMGNAPTTVSGAAAATGGVGGEFVEVDVDEELFKFSSDDTPLMNLMLKAKKVMVESAEVDHYSIDEPTAMVEVQEISGNTIKLVAADRMKVHAYDVLSVIGVQGYNLVNGSSAKSGRPLQLFVTSVVDGSDTEFIAKAINGVKTSDTDEYGTMPTETGNKIVAGTKLIILGNALYETQKEVDPDMVLPKPERIYLQKRGMNNIVSDYFDSQRKRIPFSKAIIAEAAIRNFKVKGNRTLLISQPGKLRVKAKKTGDMQYDYMTTGVRWQVKRELEHTGKWTYEQFVGLAKLFYTGEDVPNSCIVLAGKNAMESIQCIDWSKHPEVKIEVKKNDRLGWKVTSITTVFGEFQFKREPTFDRVGYENCMLLLGEDRLVHYQRKTETSFTEKVEGEEATRTGILVWDALALKGSCHIWVDGKGGETATGATKFEILGETDEIVSGSLKDGYVYYFTAPKEIPAVDGKSPKYMANTGDTYKYTVKAGWEKYYGAVDAVA